MLNYKLHEQIRKLREARRLTQVQLGKRLGVTKACICNWETDNAQPSVEMLVRLASFFSVSTDYLLGFEPGKYIDVTGLSDEMIDNLRQIAEALKTSEQNKGSSQL